MDKIKQGTPVGMTSPSLYKETEGIVSSSCVSYRELDKWALKQGEEMFDEDGLSWLGSTIRKDDPKHVVDGDYFIIYKDETLKEIDMKFKAHSIAYTIRTEKMSCIYNERSVFEKKLDAANVFHGEEDREKRTELFHQWLLKMPDAARRRFALNCSIPHSVFNIAAQFFNGDDIQNIDWREIKKRGFGNWEGNGEKVIT